MTYYQYIIYMISIYISHVIDLIEDYPLTMLGLKKEEQELIGPKMALCVKRIPHKVHSKCLRI